MIYALILFIITYILMLAFPSKKILISGISVILFLLTDYLTIKEALISIDYNIILMLIGIMGIVHLFIESEMPKKLSSIITQKITNKKILVVVISAFAGIISAFVDNVATVLMVAPIAIEICKKSKVNPCIMIISIAIFSNLEGAATLVGDTTSILLAGANNMDFFDFFIYDNKIGLFFIIQISLILSLFVLSLFVKKEKITIPKTKIKIKDYFPTILLISVLLLLIIFSFIKNKPTLTNGIICITLFIIGLIYKLVKENKLNITKQLKNIDFETIILLCNLFTIIEAIKRAGIIDLISNALLNISNNIFILYTLIVFISTLVSAFIDNIAYVAALLPIISKIALTLNVSPTLFYFGLIVGATLGGNLTPIGASANIAGINILKKEGYKISLKEYLKISLPITLTAVLSGYLLVYAIYN